MKPPGHAVISLSIGGVLWAVTKSPYSMVAASLTGVLIDLDHLVEYYRWFIKEDNTKLWFFLHSYELLVPLFLGSYFSGWDPVVMGVSFAFLGHLLTWPAGQSCGTVYVLLHIPGDEGLPATGDRTRTLG